MSARFFLVVTTVALALGACSRPNAIRAEPDAEIEWVLEVPLDGGSPERGAWAAHAKMGEVVVIHAPPEQSWGAVIGAMDVLKQVGGKRMVLAAGARRRTKTIVFPSTTEHPVAPIAPAEGEAQAPTARAFFVEVGGDGTPTLMGESGRGIEGVRRALASVEHDGGLLVSVLLVADQDAPFARVLDVVDVIQERGLRVAFGISARHPH